MEKEWEAFNDGQRFAELSKEWRENQKKQDQLQEEIQALLDKWHNK